MSCLVIRCLAKVYLLPVVHAAMRRMATRSQAPGVVGRAWRVH